MPLTAKGEKIEANMKQEYGNSKGEQVFYASKNAGTIAGVDSAVVGRCDIGVKRNFNDVTSGVNFGNVKP